eukprot:CAMPEP_0185026806 /NCGR_PEP_ID=MMETSP1103-20130426/11268_1 /TAXON_ID=36769 /ORGANISM="Paraphysomonas bandaiensis, Strain Caron Lab Isolate" /LENGTH=256 /DNA_ID=CAMNT_0027560511 /DNA_START=98 /DNA_END=868 /DNA_ORIENTATION=+
MTCAVYLPPAASDTSNKLPSLLYLSGLTCTDENVCQKGGAFRALAELNIAFIAPDTSPRNVDIPGDNDSWDFGTGAGFYLDATAEPWANNYRMYSYIVQELPQVISANFPQIDVSNMGITGHSMGGHGALTIALKNQQAYKSVSAFSPICHPMDCPWGVKAFSGYLGEDKTTWEAYDACMLLKSRGRSAYDDILVDMGLADGFLENQLKPEALKEACESCGQGLTLRLHEGYDHSYFFISSFMEDHIRFHAKHLLN